MLNFEDKDIYIQQLYRVAYKILLLNPWKNVNYFDFFLMDCTVNNSTVKYVLNLENYSTVSDDGKSFPMKTIWIHILDDKKKIMGKMEAYCCAYTAKGNIPKEYSGGALKWQKQLISDEYAPFFIDMSDNYPKPFDFDVARKVYYLFDNSYRALLNKKITGSH